MDEQTIEVWIEKQVDRLDNRFLSSDMTQADYDAAMSAIDREARVMLARFARVS